MLFSVSCGAARIAKNRVRQGIQPILLPYPPLRRQTTKQDAARDPGRWAREALIRERT